VSFETIIPEFDKSIKEGLTEARIGDIQDLRAHKKPGERRRYA
jgi:hypothetical protein